MILIPIILVIITGLLLVWIFDQHKYLNIFEQVSLGFVSSLSLFVFGLFIEGLLFNKLSFYSPLLLSIIIFSVFIWLLYKKKLFLSDIKESIKNDISKLKKDFSELKRWQKILIIIGIVYILSKIYMSFVMNISRPTVEEDAVTGWDLKTKVLFENRSLVLDQNNIEFLGSQLTRNIFAPLTDLYFLLFYKIFPINLSNILSPLVYLMSGFTLFGIFLREKGLKEAILSNYIFYSLPLIWIQSFSSYFNFVFTIFIFIFFYYISHFNENNKKIIYLLGISSFLVSTIRDEGFILMLVGFFIYHITNILIFKEKINIKKILTIFISYIGIFIGYIFTKSLEYIYADIFNKSMQHIKSLKERNIIIELFNNWRKEGIFLAPYEQLTFHPDYNIIFVIFIVLTLYYLYKYKLNDKNFIIFLSMFIAIAGTFIITLQAFLDLFGLISHFGLRYMSLFSIFMTYIITHIIIKNEK